MKLANIKIGRKLTIGFTLLLILILLSGVISIINLAKFNKNIIRIVSEDYPVIVNANNIVDEFNQIIMAQQYILLTTDTTGINQQINHIIDIRKKIGYKYDFLANTSLDPSSLQILKDFVTIRKNFIASNERFEDAMHKGDKPAAARELMDTALPIITQYRSEIRKFVDLQDNEMIGSETRVSEESKLIRSVLVILILASLAIGMLIAWRIALSITHPLQQAVNVSRKVEEDDLTGTVKIATKDEAGSIEATQVSARASDIVKRKGALMLNVTDKMRSIRTSSENMSDIIGVIDSIALQTNILALNAAVEAARAGENGRGFAVVASEVRALSQRSATAAKSIKKLIDESVNQIHDGMKLVEEAGISMADMVSNVNNVTDIMKEIAQASNEQSDGIHQINLAVGQIDSTTRQNVTLVKEAASAALSLQNQAASLTQIVSEFKLTTASLTGALSLYTKSQNTLPATADAQPAKTALPEKGESGASF